MKGIDVSSHQNNIDWGKVKADGIQFAMLRAGFGNNNIDRQFILNAQECNRLDIPIGVYWFSYAYIVSMARREARQCIEVIRPFKIDFPVAFDFEYGSVNFAKGKGIKITKSTATSFAIAFCEEIKKAGYVPMIYTNNDYMRNYFDMSKLKDYDLWYAYPTGSVNKDRSNECDIWQYSWKGRVNGIIGDVDMNVAYKHYSAKEEGDTLFTRRLRFGDTGADVGQAQRFMRNLGLYTGPIDNRFGPGQGFLNAVKAFQGQQGIEVTGEVDTATAEKITDILLARMELPQTPQDPELVKKVVEQEAQLKDYKDFFAQLKSYM